MDRDDQIDKRDAVWRGVHVDAAHGKSKATDKGPGFEIGVAFIGKRPPASYDTQPWKRYEISLGVDEELASVGEGRAPVSAEQQEHTRHRMAVDMLVEMIDPSGAVVQSEQTVTEDISAQAATLFTTLEIPVGRFIRVTSEQYRTTAHAAIRSRTTGADGIPRIHVEFVDKQWPL